MMSASAITSSKSWYDRQLDRLHREAPDEQKTTPEDALRHLPMECLAEVLDTTFKNYDARASGFAERCLVEGDMDTYHAFIKAHHDILERFSIPAPNHYQDLASIIGSYFIRKKEEKLGIIRPTAIQVYAPKMPVSPLSGPQTPCTVLSWINNVEDNTSELPPKFERNLLDIITNIPEASSHRALMNVEQRGPEPTTNTPEDSFSRVPLDLDQEEPAPNMTSCPRRQPHRKAKVETLNRSPPETLPSTRWRAGDGRVTRGRKVANHQITTAANDEAQTYKQPRGVKRRRVEDAGVASEASRVTQKRMKMASPMVKPKR